MNASNRAAIHAPAHGASTLWHERLLSLYQSGAGMFIVLLLMWIALAFISPYFLTGLNMMNLLKQTVTVGLLAAGMTLCLTAGVIDLSVGAMFALGGVIVAVLITNGVPVVPAMLISLLAAAAFGAIYAFLVSHTAMPSFIITLAAMSVVRGLAYITTGGLPRNINDPFFDELGTGLFLGVLPWAVLIYFVVIALIHVFMRYSVTGTHLAATGANFEAAKLSGINVIKIRYIAFVLCGLLAALAGILSAARIGQGQPMAGIGFEADAIAAAVLGGTAFTGGRGSMIGTFIGALVLATTRNGLNLVGASFYVQLVVQGLLIAVAVYIDTQLTSPRKRY